MTIVRFESLDSQYSYTFPTVITNQEFNTNFDKLRANFTQVPGADGGVDEHGTGLAPRPEGVINFSIWLTSPTRAGMQALRDDLHKMQTWGYGILTDSINGVERYAIGRIATLDGPQQRHEHTDLFQPISVVFKCPEPYWLAVGTGGEELWNGTRLWNSAINWASAADASITGSGSFTKTNAGSAIAIGRFVAKVTGANPISRLVIQRTVLGAAADQLVYTGPLVTNDEIEIDSREQWCLVNGVDVQENLDFTNPAWLILLPGSNTFDVYADDAAAQFSASIRYLERYT